MIVTSLQYWYSLQFFPENHFPDDIHYSIRLLADNQKLNSEKISEYFSFDFDLEAHKYSIEDLGMLSSPHPLDNFVEINMEFKILVLLVGLIVPLLIDFELFRDRNYRRLNILLNTKYGNNINKKKYINSLAFQINSLIIVISVFGILDGVVKGFSASFYLKVYYDLNYIELIKILLLFAIPFSIILNLLFVKSDKVIIDSSQ